MKRNQFFLFAAVAALPLCEGTAWADVFLDDPLNGGTSGTMDGGEFVPGGGWKAPRQIKWDLGTYLTEGVFTVQLTNWDPSAASPQHRYDKQHILAMYEAAHGSPHKSDTDSPKTGWWVVRTGANYNSLFKFKSSTYGWDEADETRNSPPHGPIDPAKTYTIKVEWKPGGKVTIFLDGEALCSHQHPRPLRLRHVFIGTDNAPAGTYGPQHDVIYKNVHVEGSATPIPDAGTPDASQTDGGGGGELRFEPVADTWAELANPDTPHGSDPEIRTGADRTIYLRFQVSGAGKVSSAHTYLKAMNHGGGGDIRVVSDNSWSEAALTWNNRPAPEQGILSSLGIVDIGDIYSFDVTQAVRGNGLHSFAITSTNTDGSGFHSRESADMHPELVIISSGPPIDAGTPDAGALADSGEPDAAADDSGVPDVYVESDASGPSDAPLALDAGETDASADSGAAPVERDASLPAEAGAAPKDAAGVETFEYDTLGCGCATLRVE
jgi:hypothetical protein